MKYLFLFIGIVIGISLYKNNSPLCIEFIPISSNYLIMYTNDTREIYDEWCTGIGYKRFDNSINIEEMKKKLTNIMMTRKIKAEMIESQLWRINKFGRF